MSETSTTHGTIGYGDALTSAILDSALDAVVVSDWSGRVVEFNRAAERTFGYEREEVLGREIGKLVVPPSLRADYRTMLEQALASGSASMSGRRFDLTAMRSNGERFPVEVSVAVIDADPPLLAGFVRDVTRRRRNEAERESTLRREREARRASEIEHRRSERLVADALDAEEAQRREISETLHDGTVQRLAAARWDLEAIGEGDTGALARAKAELDAALAEMHEAVTDIHPAVIRRVGLSAALEAIVRRAEKRGGFRAAVVADETAAGNHEPLLLSAARELLDKVVVHARASEVLVSLERRRDRRSSHGDPADTIILRIAYDGDGFEGADGEAVTAQAHVGLAAVDARLAAAGGGLEITSEGGQSTVAKAWIPLAESGVRRRLRGERRPLARLRG